MTCKLLWVAFHPRQRLPYNYFVVLFNKVVVFFQHRSANHTIAKVACIITYAAPCGMIALSEGNKLSFKLTHSNCRSLVDRQVNLAELSACSIGLVFLVHEERPRA
jgi:hypothetical protein